MRNTWIERHRVIMNSEMRVVCSHCRNTMTGDERNTLYCTRCMRNLSALDSHVQLRLNDAVIVLPAFSSFEERTKAVTNGKQSNLV